MTEAADVTVRDNPIESRYEVRVGDSLAGFTDYELGLDEITFIHTETLPAFSGRGLAGRLAQAVLHDVRRRGLSVVPNCHYIRGYIRKHQEYADLVPVDLRARFDL